MARPIQGDRPKMRVTLTQDQKVHRAAARLARARGISLSALIEMLLRTELRRERRREELDRG